MTKNIANQKQEKIKMTHGTSPLLAKWRSIAQVELGTKKQTDDLSKPIAEGFKLSPVYFADQSDEHIPGAFPFRRGVKATMYTNRPWTIRQYAGFSSAEESNAFYKRNLAAGQKGLSVAFDLPTHRGYDSDHPRAYGDVGMAGVAIDSVEDMKRLFDSIPLNDISVSMTMNGAVLPILASFIVAAEEQGASRQELQGTIQNDILKEFLVRNTYIYPPKASLRIVSDIIAYCAKEMPKFNPISISGYHMHEAGATAVQELAFTLANGLEYVRTAIKAGLNVDDFAPRLSFFFGIGMNIFMEAAKLRAARQLWAELMRNHFSPKDDKSLMLRTHCQTSGVSLQAQDPYNNVIRTAYEALAAVLGGTQSLHTNSFDEALGLPTDFSARIARNTQLILAEETHVTSVVDPLGGSYYVEALTDQLISEARKLIQDVEESGGMVAAIEDGWVRVQIEEAALEKQIRFERKEDKIVGVNLHPLKDEKMVEVLSIDNSKLKAAQIENLSLLKAKRDQKKVTEALNQLEAAASDLSQNLLALAVEAMRLRATLGEVTAALEKTFTRFQPKMSAMSGVYYGAFQKEQQFMDIKKDIDSFIAKHGRRPRILVAKIGQDGHDRGSKVVASAFADMGFDVDLGGLFQSPEEVARQAIDNDVHIIGISTLAAAHKTLIPPLMKMLKDEKASDIIVVCGGVIPPQDIPFLKEHGVQSVFGPGSDLQKAAKEILTLLQ